MRGPGPPPRMYTRPLTGEYTQPGISAASTHTPQHQASQERSVPFARPSYLQPRQLRDGKSPWAPCQFYSGILPWAPLHQRFPFPGALTRKPQGQDPLVEKEHLVNWNGIPIYFHPLILWMKVMVPNKLKALQLSTKTTPKTPYKTPFLSILSAQNYYTYTHKCNRIFLK
jgi:hypothetical protein